MIPTRSRGRRSALRRLGCWRPRSGFGPGFPATQRQVEPPLVREPADRGRDPTEHPPQERLRDRDSDPALEALLRPIPAPGLEAEGRLPAQEEPLRGTRRDKAELVGSALPE